MSGEFNTLLAVAGLILLTLMSASVVRMYQQQQAVKRQRLGILQAGIEKIEQLLDETQRLGLSREMRVLLLKEKQSRVRAMQRVFPKLPGIDERLREAGRAIEREGQQSQVTLEIEDEQLLHEVLRDLLRLKRLIAEGGLLVRIAPVERDVLIRELEEAIVACNFRFHKHMIGHYQRSGLNSKARTHLQTLTSYLKHVELETDAVVAMRTENQELSRQMFELSLNEMRGVKGGDATGKAEATAGAAQA